ncbi:MAG: hypothetical protein CVU38_03320 [Chloroflexi bacterium HGW-Chloroflexi-1]|nr:MAG: hypothetical protein CVU38_03320 [Chloroflexi bacterium HGW-Chloroflexi-1]
MTNGTAPTTLVGGQQTAEVTPVLTGREAERYWGFAHLDLVQANPFSQPGTYVVGYHQGDKAEYRLYFGGSYSNLHLVGISDRPSPVTMNIYIAGYYRGQMSWFTNDNTRDLETGSFGGISYGVHPICIEFQNDYWQYPPGGEEYDRNFYLDVLGAAN